ncbi:TPA: hypothetical protein OGO02_004184 [Klebsiella pneumoniae]|nr:hypothetical protein [Klebsiella pneumoniae]
MKTILVTVEIDVPDHASRKDIADFVDVEYGQVGGMRLDNPHRDAALCDMYVNTYKTKRHRFDAFAKTI